MSTLFEKIWNAHVVRETANEPAVLYVDFHLMHEVTSPQAFTELEQRGISVRRPEHTLATMDHSTPTVPDTRASRTLPMSGAGSGQEAQLAQLERNCDAFGVPLIGWEDSRRGIVHVIGPELGYTQPGMTIVCGDSHTSTHGAFGALAFGIGTSEVGHVLATQCLLQRRPRTMEVRIEGGLSAGVTAKDVVLAIIARIGVGGGTGHVIEYTGSTIRAMSMEERMTVCNMSIEAGARAGMIAPDETTFAYLNGKPGVPQGTEWDDAVAHWKTLRTDVGAHYDRSITIDGSSISPMISYGTNPEMSIAVDANVPSLRQGGENQSITRALQYMGVNAGEPLLGKPVQTVFIGSCTNARISDLRAAASLLAGRKVASSVRLLIVPGSQQVKRQAEAEGLAAQFISAGAEWRESGCSMCIAMNGDRANGGEYVVSTSNRNFEGRQGPAARTLLASPLTAAASAIRGVVTDPRTLL